MDRLSTYPRSAARGLVAAFVASTLTAGLTIAPTARAAANPYRGTWVLQEASSVKQLNHHTKAIRRALRLDGVIGLSVRVPWNKLEPRKNRYDFSIFKRAREIAGREKLAIRFMAGRFTPSFRRGHSMVYDGSATGGFGRGSVVPLPFGRDGGPNEVFERGWRKLVDRMARWARQRRTVRLLHLSWPGLLWAELALIDQMKRQRGYSFAAARNTHLRLLGYGLKKTTHRLFIEFASSGHAPWKLNAAIVKRLLESARRDRAFLQSNNLRPSGSGLPSDKPPPRRGAQVISGGNRYDWDAVYRQVRRMYATYLEVYTSSFRGGTSTQLRREAASFG